MPTPRPDVVVTSAAVLNPGRKISLRASRSSSAAALPESRRIHAPPVVRDLDVNETALVVRAERDRRARGLARRTPLLIGLDTVVDGIAHEVQERIRDLLDDGVVHLDRLSSELEVQALAGGAGRLASPLGEAREEPPDGHHARTRHLPAQAPGEAVHPRRVLADAPDESGQLSLDLGEVGGDLVHGPREDIEVVVTVEFELAKNLRAGFRGATGGRDGGGGQLRIRVLFLEVTHRLRHARAAESEELVDALDLREALVEAAARDDELADEVHEGVEAI